MTKFDIVKEKKGDKEIVRLIPKDEEKKEEKKEKKGKKKS